MRHTDLRLGSMCAGNYYYSRIISLVELSSEQKTGRWIMPRITVDVTLDILHRPVSHLKLNSARLSAPHRKNISLCY
jgi:tRNA(Arg) A34 adenosine deaminase TadA